MRYLLTILFILFLASSALGATINAGPGYAGGLEQASTDAGAGGTINVSGTHTATGDITTQAATQTWNFLAGSLVDLSGNAAYFFRVNFDDTILNNPVFTGHVDCYGVLRILADHSLTINNPTITNAGEGIWIRDSNSTYVVGGTLTNCGSEDRAAIKVQVTGATDSDGVSITGVRIIGGDVGIKAMTDDAIAGEVTDWTVANNVLSGQVKYYISILRAVNGFTISGNTCTGHTGQDDAWGRGIEMYGDADQSYQSGTITQNHIADVKDPTVGDTDGVGIGSDQYGTNITISRNMVVDAETFGIASNQNTTLIIDNNIIIRPGETGTNANGAGIQIGPNMTTASILNNTVWGTGAGSTHGIRIWDSATTVTVTNNAVQGTDNGLSGNDDDAGGWSGANLTNSYNCIDAGTNNFVNISAGPGAVEADPEFMKPAAGTWWGFRLRGGSLCINAGDDLSGTFTTDYKGYKRPVGSAYDIGALEHYVIHDLLQRAIEWDSSGGSWRR